MFNNKVSLPSINRVQTNTVARRDDHHHSLRTEFREEQGLRNSNLLNIAYCWRATYIYKLNIFTLARSPPNEHSSKKMQYLTLAEFGVQGGSGPWELVSLSVLLKEVERPCFQDQESKGNSLQLARGLCTCSSNGQLRGCVAISPSFS